MYLKDTKLGCWAPLHYGDPPSHGCVGDTENCYDLRVVEFWEKSYDRPVDIKWARHPEFEVHLQDIPPVEERPSDAT